VFLKDRAYASLSKCVLSRNDFCFWAWEDVMLESEEGDVSDAAAQGGDLTNAALELRKILVVVDEENGEEVSCTHTHTYVHTRTRRMGKRYQRLTDIHTHTHTHT
jgi:hypothetical protein